MREVGQMSRRWRDLEGGGGIGQGRCSTDSENPSSWLVAGFHEEEEACGPQWLPGNNTSQPHLFLDHRRHVDDRAQAGYRGTSVLYHFGISLFTVQNSDLYMP
jgi:hypothetical protein